MGLPKGINNGAHGIKCRSGRKSAYQEHADAKLLWDIFFDELNKEEIREKIKSGRYSLKDVFIQKGFDGNERVLIEIFKKLFPDKSLVKGQSQVTRVEVDLSSFTEDELAGFAQTGSLPDRLK